MSNDESRQIINDRLESGKLNRNANKQALASKSKLPEYMSMRYEFVALVGKNVIVEIPN